MKARTRTDRNRRTKRERVGSLAARFVPDGAGSAIDLPAIPRAHERLDAIELGIDRFELAAQAPDVGVDDPLDDHGVVAAEDFEQAGAREDDPRLAREDLEQAELRDGDHD